MANVTVRPDKLSLIVFSGEFDKIHYALVLASGAAAIGTPVTLFFTMEATRALLKAEDEDAPTWAAQPTCASEFNDGAAMDAAFKRRGVADFEGLLMACVEMEVRFMACEMGLQAMDLERANLRADVPIEPGGVVTFLNDASKTGSIIFV